MFTSFTQCAPLHQHAIHISMSDSEYNANTFICDEHAEKKEEEEEEEGEENNMIRRRYIIIHTHTHTHVHIHIHIHIHTHATFISSHTVQCVV